MQTSKVRFIDEREVVGLFSDPNKKSITGARIRKRNSLDQNENPDEEILTNLIVDASGRESRAPQWLESLGYASPQESTINSFLGYSSRLYRRPHDDRRDWKGLLLRATPPTNLRSAVILPVEGDRWIVTLGGSGRNYPPTAGGVAV